jgi:DNA-binding MarR family transcriptional regulator
MPFEKLAPGEDKILDCLRAGPMTFTTLHEKTGLARSILTRYLKQLQKKRMVERTLEERKYCLLNEGRKAVSCRDDILLITRTDQVLRNEIRPNPDKPQILPVDVSTYLSPEVKDLLVIVLEELKETKGPTVTEDEAQHDLLREIGSQAISHFEDIFVRRFLKIAKDWHVYSIQQMNPAERRKFLKRLHCWELVLGRSAAARRSREATLDKLEKEYMRYELPEGGPTINFDDALNFEASLVVGVSREKIREDSEKIRNRLTTYLLEKELDERIEKPPGILLAMMKTGMITNEEFEEYGQARTRDKIRVIRQLHRKYYNLAWGKPLQE